MTKHRIATGHPLVTDTARAILQAGGNAFDAAVAACFTSSVAEPTLTSLAGGGFLMFKKAGGKVRVLDFFTDTPGKGRIVKGQDTGRDFYPVTVKFPGADQVFHIGKGAAAVPGVLAGLDHIASNLGTMPLHELAQPAARLAKEGIPLSARQRSFVQLLWPILMASEESRAVFDPLPDEGASLRQSEAATFLHDVEHGVVDSFYHGDLAKLMSDTMAAEGGLITRRDLAEYQPILREPLHAQMNGHAIYLNPPPSGGGVRVQQYIRELHGTGASDPTLRLALAMRDGERHIAAQSAPQFPRGTTHLSIADKWGNIATMTTSNGEGCAYIVPGTGIMLNNMLGEDDLYPGGFEIHEPGIRVSSMMCPTIAEGKHVLALGSGGSQRIRSAVLQVLSHVLESNMPLADAVQSPRVHFDGETLQVEPGFNSAVLEELRPHFDDINIWQDKNLYFGGVHAVSEVAAAGDARRDGDPLVCE